MEAAVRLHCCLDALTSRHYMEAWLQPDSSGALSLQLQLVWQWCEVPASAVGEVGSVVLPDGSTHRLVSNRGKW